MEGAAYGQAFESQSLPAFCGFEEIFKKSYNSY